MTAPSVYRLSSAGPFSPTFSCCETIREPKKIIEQFSEQVVAVPFDGGSIDLDTVADYNQYLKTFGKTGEEDHLHH